MTEQIDSPEHSRQDYNLLRDLFAEGFSRSDIVGIVKTSKTPVALTYYFQSLEKIYGPAPRKRRKTPWRQEDDQQTDTENENAIEDNRPALSCQETIPIDPELTEQNDSPCTTDGSQDKRERQDSTKPFGQYTSMSAHEVVELFDSDNARHVRSFAENVSMAQAVSEGSVSTRPTETTAEECNEMLKAENEQLHQQLKDVTSYMNQQVRELEPVFKKLEQSKQKVLESGKYKQYLVIQDLRANQKIPWKDVPAKFEAQTGLRRSETTLQAIFRSMNETLESAGFKEPKQDIPDEPPKPNSVSNVFYHAKSQFFSDRVSSSILSGIDCHHEYCTE